MEKVVGVLFTPSGVIAQEPNGEKIEINKLLNAASKGYRLESTMPFGENSQGILLVLRADKDASEDPQKLFAVYSKNGRVICEEPGYGGMEIKFPSLEDSDESDYWNIKETFSIGENSNCKLFLLERQT